VTLQGTGQNPTCRVPAYSGVEKNEHVPTPGQSAPVKQYLLQTDPNVQ
jgi:hypothetical protein